MGIKRQLALFFRFLQQLICNPVRLKTHEDADLLNIFEGWIQLVEPADEEVPDQAIEVAGILAEQHSEAVAQTLSGLISETKVRSDDTCAEVTPATVFNGAIVYKTPLRF